MLQTSTGIRPNMKEKPIILEWGSLFRSSYGTEYRHDGRHKFLHIVYEFCKILLTDHIMDDHMVGSAQNLKILLREI